MGFQSICETPAVAMFLLCLSSQNTAAAKETDFINFLFRVFDKIN
jgi:hypothetical protein